MAYDKNGNSLPITAPVYNPGDPTHPWQQTAGVWYTDGGAPYPGQDSLSTTMFDQPGSSISEQVPTVIHYFRTLLKCDIYWTGGHMDNKTVFQKDWSVSQTYPNVNLRDYVIPATLPSQPPDSPPIQN